MMNHKDISRRNILSTAIAGSLATLGFDEVLANCVPDRIENLRPAKDLIAYRNFKSDSHYWSSGCNNPGYRLFPRGMLYFDKNESGKDVLVAESGFVVNYHPKNTRNKVDQWLTFSKAVYSKNKNEGFKVSFYNNSKKLIKTLTQAQVFNPHTKDKVFSYSHPSNSGRAGIEDEHRFRKRSLEDRPNAPNLNQEAVRARMRDNAMAMIHEFFGNLRRLNRFRYAGVIASQGDGWTPAYYAPRLHEAANAGINRIEMIQLDWTPIIGNNPPDLITGSFFISSVSASARTASQQLREHQGSYRYNYEFTAVRQGQDIENNTHDYRIFVNVVRYRVSPRNRQVTLSLTPFISTAAGRIGISDNFLTPQFSPWRRYGILIDDLRAAVTRYRRELDQEDERIRESVANALIAPETYMPGIQNQIVLPAGADNPALNRQNLAVWPGMVVLCLGAEIYSELGAPPQFQRNQVDALDAPIIPNDGLLGAAQAYTSALRDLNAFITDRAEGVNEAGIAGRNITWPFATLGFRDENAEHRRLLGYTHDVVKEKTKPAPKNDPKYGGFVKPGGVCRVCSDKDEWYDSDAVKT